MIVNEEILPEKFKPLARKVDCYFEELNIGEVKAEAKHQLEMEVSYVEYKNEKIRFVFYYSPEDAEREEQIHVTNIIFDSIIRHKGYFSGLMDILIEWCEKENNMPILFEQAVSDNFSNILIDKYNGKVVYEDWRGKFIFVLCQLTRL